MKAMPGGRLKKAFIFAAALGAALACLSLPSCENSRPPKEAQNIEEAGPSSGEGRVALSPASRARELISVKPLEPMHYQKEIRVFGRVLEVQEFAAINGKLVQLRSGIFTSRHGVAVAQARLAKAEARLAASVQEHERLEALYADEQNVSKKALQAGWAAWQSDISDKTAAEQDLLNMKESLQASQQTLNNFRHTVLQKWGAVLTNWIWQGRPQVRQFLINREVLIQITVPAGTPLPEPPKTLPVQAPSNETISARFISRSPRTDPGIQGMSCFYSAPPKAALLAGMNISALIPAGPSAEGCFIPGSAVVWYQGEAWAYVQKGEDNYLRLRVPTANPVKDGYFAADAFKPGELIVVKGAQVLLSDELLAGTGKGGK